MVKFHLNLNLVQCYVLKSKVLRELLSNSSSDIFPDLNTHIFDDSIEELSGLIFRLTKLIV